LKGEVAGGTSDSANTGRRQCGRSGIGHYCSVTV
jgi:hypothetical protein